MLTNKLESTHGLQFNLSVKSKGVLKVICGRIHFKSGSISKTVLDRDVETTVHKQVMIHGLFNSSNCDDLGVSQGHSSIVSFFKWDISLLQDFCRVLQ